MGARMSSFGKVRHYYDSRAAAVAWATATRIDVFFWLWAPTPGWLVAGGWRLWRLEAGGWLAAGLAGWRLLGVWRLAWRSLKLSASSSLTHSKFSLYR